MNMKKLTPFLIIILLTFFLPIKSWGQFNDIWIIEDMLQETQEEQKTGEQITLISIALHWSADTYTPTSYSGRALPTKGSLVSVYTDLEILEGDPINLKYSWFLDNIFQENKSGYGQDSFQFGVRRFNDNSHKVLLKVFNDSRSFYIEKSIEIPVVNPEVVIYPLYYSDGRTYSPEQTNGMSYIKSEEKTSFIAVPYFFNVEKLTDLNFEWSLSNQKPVVSSTYNANILDLAIKKEGVQPLETKLEINVSNKIGTIQSASQTIKIQVY